MRKLVFVSLLLALVLSLSGCQMIFDLFGIGDDEEDDAPSVTIPQDMYEPDNDPGSANPLYLNTPQDHTLHSSSDEDWFVLMEDSSTYLGAGQSIVVQISPVPGGAPISDVDFDVYDSEGTLVGYGASEDPNSTESAVIDTAAYVSPYVLVVYPWTGTGDYSVEWYFEPI